MAKEAVAAAGKLMIEDEIMVNVIVLSQLSPLPIADLKELLADEPWIVTVEEGTLTGGIGAEIAAKCFENRLCSHITRIAALDIPIPNGIELEKQVIPNEDTIYSRVREAINEN